MHKHFRRTRRGPPNPDDMFKEIRLFVPKSIYEMLKAKSTVDHLPISKMANIGFDNEFELGSKSFFYPVDYEMPDVPFMPDAYASEANKIFECLRKQKLGMALDNLVLCRRDIGIMDKREFLLAFRELVRSGLIESFYPEKASFRYPLDYVYWRVKPTEEQLREAKKKKAKYETVENKDEERPE